MSALFPLYLCGRNAAEWVICMKKLIALVLALACVLSLVGCNPKQADTSEENQIIIDTEELEKSNFIEMDE